MFWLPIVFVCTANAECGFIFDKTYESKSKCMQALQKMEKTLPKENFPTFRAACLDLEVSSGGRI